jgi:hypothetical protein
VLHPVGPLPASVYWRRRAVAFAGVIVVLMLFNWTVGGGTGNSNGSGTRPASAQGSGAGQATGHGATAATGTGAPTGTAASGSPSTTGTPPPLDQSGPVDRGPAAGSTGGDPTGTATVTASRSSTSAAAEPPRPCRDGALRLTVRTVQPYYRVGELPVIELTVQNVSATTCTRDLGAAQQEVLLYAAATRIWSSNDCYPGGSRDVQALLPRERATFTVTWSGLSSRPRCAGTRTRVGPGNYRLLGRIGTLRSTTATLALR